MLIQGMELREDLTWLANFDAVAGVTNPNVVVAGRMEKDHLATAMAEIEKHRLVVARVLMSPWGTRAIRSWKFENLDQLGMLQVRESGYLGRMFGADFWVTDQISLVGTNPATQTTSLYVMAQKKFLGWQPMRKDLEVIPADEPDLAYLGFVGYELLGMYLFNTRAICKLIWTARA